MRQDRARWERRYLSRAPSASDPPSEFLRRECHRIPPGPVLDVAAGDGRHALYLARQGYSVDGVDIAFEGLRRIAAVARRERLSVRLVQADLEEFPLPRSRYAAIVNIRYLQRSLLPSMKAAVRPGGLIIFETFLIDQRQLGHPTNPDHLLEHGELIDLLHGFEILIAEEGHFITEGGPAFLSRAVARRPEAQGRV